MPRQRRKLNAELGQYLGRQNALLLYFGSVGGKDLSMWQAQGKVFMIVEQPNGLGWEIFVPVSESIQIDPTFAAMDAYLGKRSEN